MNIIIIGDGKMGYSLASALVDEGHNVTIIDMNDDVLEATRGTLDVECICGDGTNASTQLEAGVSGSDLVIATTIRDETNIICCLIAKKLGAKHTIVRIRKKELSDSIKLLRKELGISMIVNPDYAAATEISRILRMPSVVNVEVFAHGKVELVEIKLPEKCPLDGTVISELPGRFQLQLIICTVKRGENVYIPDGNFTLHSGDEISVTAAPSTFSRLFEVLGIGKQSVRSIIIASGGAASSYLVQQLEAAGSMSIKLIDSDRDRCAELSTLFPSALVLHGFATNSELLRRAGIELADAVVGLTSLDEDNVMVAMQALANHVPRVVTCINHASFGAVVDRAGIDCVVTPHRIETNNILRYIRAVSNSNDSGVDTLTRIADNRIEALEFHVGKNFGGCSVPLKTLRLKKNLLIACIIRTDGSLVFPCGSDVINEGDSVIVITGAGRFSDLVEILER